MSERDESLDFEELSLSERPPSVPDELPILPLRDTVLFPNSFMPLAVARESSVRLIDEAISGGKVAGRVGEAGGMPWAGAAGGRPA